VWQGVATNLVGSQRQPELVVTNVDGDSNPELRNLFNVTVYPTFLLVNKDGNKVLGRYLGPRKVFELSTWITDLIVAAENPVVKHQFDAADQGAHADLYPVFPYNGSVAAKVVGEQSLVSVSVGLSGNDFDDCAESDELKFTSPGVALLVHYPSTASSRALEADSNILSTTKVAEKLTVVDFMVSWCPHCQKLNPVWDQLSSRLAERTDVLVVKVDLEQHPDVKRDFGIHRFPTVVYFDAGKPMSFDEAHRFSGQRDAEHLQQWIDQISSPH
jgi:thioredoxin-like negative regulator of GroEL